MNLDINKLYYYCICLIAAFVLLWGAIDFVSAGVSYIVPAAPSPDQSNEEFYQKRVAQDRIFDAIARIVISGAVFVYCRKKV